MLNDEKIIKYMSEFYEENEREAFYAYGVVEAAIGKGILFGSLASFTNKFILVGFTDRKLIIIGLDTLGEPKTSRCIDYKNFVSAKIRRGLICMGKTIKIRLSDDSEVHFSLNKHISGLKNQKKNIQAICKSLEPLMNK